MENVETQADVNLVNRAGDETGAFPHVCRMTGASWPEIATRVRESCARFLRHRPDIDPEDAGQNVLVIILRRDFGRKFDPRRGSFWQFVEGVIRNECLRLFRMAAHEREALADVECESLESHVPDPCVQAQHTEFRERFSTAVDSLTEVEQSALSRVTELAEGSRRESSVLNSTPYVQELRCRLRLRRILTGFE